MGLQNLYWSNGLWLERLWIARCLSGKLRSGWSMIWYWAECEDRRSPQKPLQHKTRHNKTTGTRSAMKSVQSAHRSTSVCHTPLACSQCHPLTQPSAHMYGRVTGRCRSSAGWLRAFCPHSYYGDCNAESWGSRWTIKPLFSKYNRHTVYFIHACMHRLIETRYYCAMFKLYMDYIYSHAQDAELHKDWLPIIYVWRLDVKRLQQ